MAQKIGATVMWPRITTDTIFIMSNVLIMNRHLLLNVRLLSRAVARKSLFGPPVVSSLEVLKESDVLVQVRIPLWILALELVYRKAF